MNAIVLSGDDIFAMMRIPIPKIRYCDGCFAIFVLLMAGMDFKKNISSMLPASLATQ